NLPFVRVDFYSVNNKTIFGEMTFYPEDGKVNFLPDEYNSIIGDYLTLPKIPEDHKIITVF
ncbi:ATP-grasp fold amidoligase family protein, partial [Lutibacter sp.]|uniref:ATP-grasp fold amidoligase family protein n=1 Tax=Lutibacter sp. TaxID=1925666 RepID=UPI0034A08B8A